MTRFLLALLALLGFAVQVAPAEAAANCGIGSAEIGALAVTRGPVCKAVAQVERFVAPPSRQAKYTEVRLSAFPRTGAILVPAVLIGIDRARE